MLKCSNTMHKHVFQNTATTRTEKSSSSSGQSFYKAKVVNHSQKFKKSNNCLKSEQSQKISYTSSKITFFDMNTRWKAKNLLSRSKCFVLVLASPSCPPFQLFQKKKCNSKKNYFSKGSSLENVQPYPLSTLSKQKGRT